MSGNLKLAPQPPGTCKNNLQNITISVSSTGRPIPFIPSSLFPQPLPKNWKHLRKKIYLTRSCENGHLSFLRADQPERFFTDVLCYITINHILIHLRWILPPLHSTSHPESLIRLRIWLFFNLEQSWVLCSLSRCEVYTSNIHNLIKTYISAII